MNHCNDQLIENEDENYYKESVSYPGYPFSEMFKSLPLSSIFNL